MVNRKRRERGCQGGIPALCPARWLLFLLVSGLMEVGAAAQSIENRYRSHLTENGTTYFFCPKQVGNTQAAEKFTFDMTYHTAGDSVALNFTIYERSLRNVDRLCLRGGSEEAVSVAKTLYADLTGNRYEIRTGAVFALTDMYRLFSQPEPLMFDLTFKDGTKGTASYSPRSWRKEQKQIIRIMDLINVMK